MDLDNIKITSLTDKPLKGILKHPTATPIGAAPPPPISQDEARQIALKHAAIIQERKNFETAILEAIIRLIDLPIERGPAYSAAHPAARDVDEFKALIRTFQPTDYDDLVEERNTCDLCGYALCANPRQKFAGTGSWKLVNAGTKDFGIVQKKDLEKWCSQECAKRALYVKVQLNESAAWERVGIPDIQIDLFEEETLGNIRDEQLAQELGRLKLEERRKGGPESSALALERGAQQRDIADEIAEMNIVEKTVTQAPTAPSLQTDIDDDDDHTYLEGYRPKFGAKG